MTRSTSRPQPEPATLRVGGVLEILAVLKQFKVDPDEVLTAVGIDSGLLDDPDNLITYDARGHLLNQCVAQTGCQHFGLLLGQRMNLRSLGLTGLLMKTSRNTGAALRGLVNYLHLHTQGAVTTLRVDCGLAVLSYESVRPNAVASEQTGDGAVAMMLNVMRALCGPKFQPLEASFARRSPADIEPFRKFFQCPVYFNADRFALLFSHDWLEIHPPSADADLQRWLQKQADALSSKRTEEFPEQVRRVLRSSLLTGHCSEEQVAALFSMHARSLGRRLQASGVSFRELTDQCRFDIAQEMLRNTSLSVGQIGTSLDYSRASAFIRAFRRWSGSTPAQWRTAHASHVQMPQ